MTYPARNPAADLRAEIPPWEPQPFLTGVCCCGRVTNTVDEQHLPAHPKCRRSAAPAPPAPPVAPSVDDIPEDLEAAAEAEAEVLARRVPPWAWAIYDREA